VTQYRDSPRNVSPDEAATTADHCVLTTESAAPSFGVVHVSIRPAAAAWMQVHGSGGLRRSFVSDSSLSLKHTGRIRFANASSTRTRTRRSSMSIKVSGVGGEI
jgi:hypothetical protein